MKYTSGGNIYPARFVKADSTDGQVVQADLGAVVLGISGQAQKDAREDVANTYHAESGDQCQVNSGDGVDTDAVVMLELGGSVSFGDKLMPDANGKGITATAGENVGATALSDGASGELVPVRPEPGTLVAGSTGVVITETADYTVLSGETGSTYSTAGASATVTFAMPAATVGLKYRFYVGAAQELRIDPNGTETIALPSTGVQGAAGKYLTANAAGETVDIECVVAGSWSVFGYTGTWTAEA